MGAIALAALVVAIASWFRPASTVEAAEPAAAEYTEQQVADAQEAVCAAYEKAYAATSNAGRQATNSADGPFIVAINTRLAFHASGDYLAVSLSENPATPTELKAGIQELVSSYHDVVLAQIAVAPEETLDPIYKRMDAAAATIDEFCT